jgi:hypothetical protein
MPEEAVVNRRTHENTVGNVRAQRFVLQLPVRCRLSGEGTWWRGETENISSSGVLFRSELFADLDSSVELCLTMPAVNSDGTAEVICRGLIVRAMAAAGLRDHPRLAVKILHFRLVRP